MTAPFRFLAWLVLPALMSCSFNLLAATAEGAPQALHLLDYIGADYPPTVEAGKVVDESEFREQVEFLGVLQGLVAQLPEKPERVELIKGVDELLAAVTAHADGATVAHQARQLGARLAVAYEVRRSLPTRRAVRRCMPSIVRCATARPALAMARPAWA
jgi:high-affinity iron transporter